MRTILCVRRSTSDACAVRGRADQRRCLPAGSPRRVAAHAGPPVGPSRLGDTGCCASTVRFGCGGSSLRGVFGVRVTMLCREGGWAAGAAPLNCSSRRYSSTLSPQVLVHSPHPLVLGKTRYSPAASLGSRRSDDVPCTPCRYGADANHGCPRAISVAEIASVGLGDGLLLWVRSSHTGDVHNAVARDYSRTHAVTTISPT
jgi:hypothetical protein